MTRKKIDAQQRLIDAEEPTGPRWTKAALLLMDDPKTPYVLRFELSGTRASEIEIPLNDEQVDKLIANFRVMQSDHALRQAGQKAAEL